MTCTIDRRICGKEGRNLSMRLSGKDRTSGMKGRLADPEPRNCLVCGEEYIPSRRTQKYCPPPKRCRNSARAREIAREFGLGLEPRDCVKCGREFKPRANDQVTCGAGCPGRPDEIRECVNPRCELPARDENGHHLLARQFIIKGNSQGKGNQSYCSERCRDQNSRWRLAQRFRRYGVTPEQYQTMVAEQGNKCAICGEPPAPAPQQNWRDGEWDLAVDHDHETGDLRDLLCQRHNQGIGLFEDNPEWLRAAADYVERHKNASCPRPWHETFVKPVASEARPRNAVRLPMPPERFRDNRPS